MNEYLKYQFDIHDEVHVNKVNQQKVHNLCVDERKFLRSLKFSYMQHVYVLECLILILDLQICVIFYLAPKKSTCLLHVLRRPIMVLLHLLSWD